MDSHKKMIAILSSRVNEYLLHEEQKNFLQKGTDIEVLLCALFSNIKKKMDDKSMKVVDLEWLVADLINRYCQEHNINIYAKDYVDPVNVDMKH